LDARSLPPRTELNDGGRRAAADNDQRRDEILQGAWFSVVDSGERRAACGLHEYPMID